MPAVHHQEAFSCGPRGGGGDTMMCDVLRIRVSRRAVRLGIFSLLVAGSVLLVGCTSDANDRATRLIALLLRASDLPPGWQRDRGGRGRLDQEREGIISRFVVFLRVPERQRAGAPVWQELIDDPNTNQAGDTFADIVRMEIPNNGWTWPEQVDFPYRADQIEVACTQDPDSPGTTWCTSVAQYGNFVSIIYAHVYEEQWLTMEDLERLLESIDKRMAAARDQP